MGQQKNTVIINGKTYDTSSGDLLNTPRGHHNLVKDISGPTRPSDNHLAKKARTSHHLAHHKPQKSVTLKRLPGQKRTAVAGSKSMPLGGVSTIITETNKLLFSGHDRHDRSKKISKSHAISRFNKSSYEPTVTKRHEPIDVQPAPSEDNKYFGVVPNIDHSTSQDIFSKALSQANSHRQPPVKHSNGKHRIAKKLGVSNRTANVIAIALVIVVLGGFIAYQNASNVSLHMAEARSGLSSASLPNYKPSGFTLSRHMATAPGQIVLSFHSNSDSRAFTITQTSSNWSSQTLADSYLSGQTAKQLSQSDGKTIYLYGDSNATWVDGGIWYRIEGNSSLTSDQLVKIASSF